MYAKKFTTAAVTAIAATGLAAPAIASPTPKTFAGSNGKLTVSIGDNQLHFGSSTPGGGGTQQMPSQKVVDAEWAPDGSRVVYLDENNNLVSVRADSTDLIVIATGLTGASHPTWMNGGSFIVYAQGGDLYKVPSLGGTAPVKLGAGHQSGDHDSAPQGGPNGSLVFQRTSGGVSWVWTYNGYSDTAAKVANTNAGTSPSIAPDGSQIAFITKDHNGIAQVWTVQADGSNLTQLTFDTLPAQKDDTPVWSPDGSMLAFAASGAIVTMQPTPHATESTAATIVGRISWQPNADLTQPPSATNPVNLVERLDGPDRIGTAVQVSRWSWGDAAANPPANKQANVAVIARSDIFADALAGSALAARFHGPLLLTPTGNLDSRTAAELNRILKPGSFVYVLGEKQAISESTFNQIAATGAAFRPSRIGGLDRFATATDIAKTIVPTYTQDPVTILTATGMNFPDALAAGAVAGSRPNTVVVLTNDTKMPVNTLGFLNAVPQRTVFGIGGAAVTALNSVNIPATPVAGSDRFVTATMVAHTFFGGPQVVGIATGYNFPDALAGGALAGSVGGPLLLTGPTQLPTQTADYLRNASGSISDAVMFGGPAVLTDSLKNQVGDLIGQPGQWVYAENDPSKHQGPLLAVR